MPLRRGWKPSVQGTQSSSMPPPSQGQGSERNDGQSDAQGGGMADTLKRENFQLREKNRRLQEQLDGANTAYEQYQALGAPGEVAAKLRKAELERVAGRAGLNPTVFADLDRMAGGRLEYEVKTEEVDGSQVERVWVKDVSLPDAQPQLLSEYAQTKWAAYLPALQPVANGQQPAASSQQPLGVRFPQQHPGGAGAAVTTKTVAEGALKKAYAPRKPATS